MPEREIYTSRSQVADLLGVSLPTVDKYVRLGMPGEDRKYDAEACLEWYERYRRQHARSGSDGDDETDIELRRRKLEAEVHKLEQEGRAKQLKNDQLEGRLLPADDTRQWVAAAFLRIKARLEMLPDEHQSLAPAAVRPQFRRDMERAMHELLLEISGWELTVEGDDIGTE